MLLKNTVCSFQAVDQKNYKTILTNHFTVKVFVTRRAPAPKTSGKGECKGRAYE